MGRRGPAPKPTALKVLNGSAAHHPERRNQHEPQPLRRDPEPPNDLEPAARLVWDRVMTSQAPGVILAAHADVLRVYCETVVRYEAWSLLLARSGGLIRGSRGHELVRNPLVQMVRDTGDQVRLFARELGLTPSSISLMHAAPNAQPSKMAGLLQPRRNTG